MKRVALIHTVRSVLDGFEPQLREALSGPVLIHNIFDDFLATDPAVLGFFSDVNKRRLANDLANAELTGADLIVVTCSTLTPAVEELRTAMNVPVLAIDDAMCRKAVGYGSRVLVMATARSTLEPTTAKIRDEAAKAGVTVDMRTLLREKALAALKAGDGEAHDRILEEAAGEIGGADAVVLAQASMARAEARIAAACGLPVLTSPSLCIAEAKRLLGE